MTVSRDPRQGCDSAGPCPDLRREQEEFDEATRYLNLARDQLRREVGPARATLADALAARAVALRPDDPSILLGAARVRAGLGMLGEARATCARILELEPESVEARILACILDVPGLNTDDEETSRCRESYRRGLEELLHAFDPDDPGAVRRYAGSLGPPPFFLPHQGRDDLELQRLHGTLAARAMGARYPRWSRSPGFPVRRPGEPVRLAVVCAFFQSHPVWNVFLRGWLEALDPERFDVVCHHLGDGDADDDETERARRLCRRFVEGKGSLRDRAAGIVAERPHVVLFPELGMHGDTYRLAALRLADTQIAAWGQPATSGLPTIDWFLSAALVEAPGAESHYSERLHVLPDLSIRFQPRERAPSELGRAGYGLAETDIVYLCSQSLFKCLPRFVRLLPAIASRVPGSRFVFVEDPMSRVATKRFRTWIREVFAAAGMDGDARVTVLPRLSFDRYLELNRLADVFIDTIGWSGCATTLDALGAELPVVTMDGEFFRGRQSAGILRRAGLGDTVARNEAEYVERAVRLGLDPAARARTRERIRAGSPLLRDDRAATEALVTFLDLVSRGRDPGPGRRAGTGSSPDGRE